MNNFTCDRCQVTFNKGRSEEEARKELETSPWNIPGDAIGVVCDDCFEAFKIWFDSLTEEDHKRIRNE
jgi:hypothetical protein